MPNILCKNHNFYKDVAKAKYDLITWLTKLLMLDMRLEF